MASALRSIFLPIALDNPFNVISSYVGPRPPREKIHSGDLSIADRKTSEISPSSSRTVVLRVTRAPSSTRRFEIQWEFVSRVVPLSSSFPTTTISTLLCFWFISEMASSPLGISKNHFCLYDSKKIACDIPNRNCGFGQVHALLGPPPMVCGQGSFNCVREP